MKLVGTLEDGSKVNVSTTVVSEKKTPDFSRPNWKSKSVNIAGKFVKVFHSDNSRGNGHYFKFGEEMHYVSNAEFLGPKSYIAVKKEEKPIAKTSKKSATKALPKKSKKAATIVDEVVAE